MKNIKLYNASAGSGKTHTVSHAIISRIQAGLDPARIIATTFTNKAADELKERIRKDLIKKEMYDAAIRINSAQIGTVNSIGGRLLEKYAVFAGLPPKLSVIDEDTASNAIRQIIARHISEDFIKVAERMDQVEDDKYVKDIYKIALAIRANDMGKEQIAASCENSLAEAIQVYGNVVQSNSWEPKMEMLIEKLKPFVERAEADPDILVIKGKRRKQGYNALEAVVNQWNELYRHYNSNQNISWLKKFNILDVSKLPEGYRDEFYAIHAAYYPLFTCVEFQQDLTVYYQSVFAIAEKTQLEFSDWKAERGYIDFTDQEQKLYRLLKNNREVKVDFSKSFDLLLVDEFQDTSPLQLALFVEINACVKETIWVGDPKQSIYGFRGADFQLMEAVIKEVDKNENDNTTEELDTSWRSRKDLVHLSNALFKEPFIKKHSMLENRICLKVSEPRASTPEKMGTAFRLWNVKLEEKANLKKDFYPNIAKKVKKLIDENNLVLVKGKEKQQDTRQMRGGDIALLFDKNDQCSCMADALVQLGLKVCSRSTGLFQQAEIILLLAALKLSANKNDSLARAEILLLEKFKGSQEEMILSRLNYLNSNHENQDSWEADGSGMVKSIHAKASILRGLSLKDRTIWISGIIGIQRHIHSWSNPGQRSANIEQLLAFITQYEDSCTILGKIADIYGFMIYADELTENEKDSLGVFSDKDTVTVSTIHAAKGLEWPLVVVNDLTWQHSYGKHFYGVYIKGAEHFEAKNPLAGRQVRYYMKPASGNSKIWAEIKTEELKANWGSDKKKTAEGEDGEDDSRVGIEKKFKDYLSICDKESLEELRKFYVAYTRARDYLILTYSSSFGQNKFLKITEDISKGNSYPSLSGAWVNGLNDGVNQTNLIDGFLEEKQGVKVESEVISGDNNEAQKGDHQNPFYFTNFVSDKRQMPLHVYPSEKEKQDSGITAKLIHTFDCKILVYLKLERDKSTDLGNCIHYFLAAAAVNPSEEWERIARHLISNSNMENHLKAEDFVKYASDYISWLDLKSTDYYYSELPVKFRNEEQQIVSGSLDVYLERNAESWILDHKTFNPGEQISEEVLGSLVVKRFSSQMMANKQIMEAAGKTAVKTFIHLPMHGKVFELIME